MTAVLIDAAMGDDERRRQLYSGSICVLPPTPSSLALCAFAHELIQQAFGARDPETAQNDLPVDEFAAILAALKPKFIHHPESKRLIRLLLREAGCDPQKTYFDVPRMRTSTSNDYLTSGIAYAFHPHRDTWYSAPMCQVNWWMPIYPIESGNSMAFHPRYWSEPVKNGSADYDYQRWNATSRFNAAQQIGKDTREQPRPLEPVETEPDLRVILPVGSLLAFSAAQLHSSAPNFTGRTRYSIDFRTVNIDDAASGAGAPNIDSYCTGTAMPDYLRLTDLSHVPEEIVQKYMPGHPQQVRTPEPRVASQA